MKSHFLLLTIFGCLGVSLQANTEAEALPNAEIAQLDIDDDGQDIYCDENGNCYYYDDGYYNDGVVWVGPGWYYGRWFNNESGFWGYRRNFYGRGNLGRGAERRGARRGERREGRRDGRRMGEGRGGGRRANAGQRGGGGRRGGGGGGGGGRRGGGGGGRGRR